EAMARDRLGIRSVSLPSPERVRIEISTKPEAASEADLILFCVKTIDTDGAASQIAPHLRPSAIVVDLQNGVDNPERLRRAGIDPIPAVVFVAAAVERPGEVTHRGRGDLVIGHPARPDDVRRVKGWFEAAGVPCRVADDIDRELWIKLILNSMTNAISALTGKPYGQVARFGPTWEIALEVAREAAATARAEGHEFDRDELAETCREICLGIRDATSSTEQDVARGRPTEIDSLNGFIARRGEAAGVPTPVNHALHALVKLRERTGD
ncbi:MAG TPA: 2-dehydropantoate 2-reductase, partial [Candidatus Saccharimonadales bacterium]|nr:2-dehydropantoate 2-reductase [Candidatus Saccharimonadales bacterium]